MTTNYKAAVLIGAARGDRLSAVSHGNRPGGVYISPEYSFAEIRLPARPQRLRSAGSNPSAIRKAVLYAAKFSFFDKRIDIVISNGGVAGAEWKDDKSMDDASTLGPVASLHRHQSDCFVCPFAGSDPIHETHGRPDQTTHQRSWSVHHPRGLTPEVVQSTSIRSEPGRLLELEGGTARTDAQHGIVALQMGHPGQFGRARAGQGNA